MQNDIILLLVVLIVAICLGAGYWLFVRTVRELQASTQRQLEANTQEMRSLVQQEIAVLRQVLTRTTGQDQWGEMQLEPIVDCELDGTDTDQYDMSGIPKLRGAKQVLDSSQEEEVFRQEMKHTGSDKNKSGGEAKQPLNEGEPVQESQIPSTPRENDSMLCPFCRTPHREHARFCRGCGQSLAETEALTQIVTAAVEDYRSMSLTELRQMQTPQAISERCRRAVDAIMAYNDAAAMPAMRWYINPAVVVDLVGGRPPDVKEYLTLRRAEIDAHHQKYRLSSGYNRGRATSISRSIQIPEWPSRELELGATLHTQE
jgi:hypothetical protein